MILVDFVVYDLTNVMHTSPLLPTSPCHQVVQYKRKLLYPIKVRTTVIVSLLMYLQYFGIDTVVEMRKDVEHENKYISELSGY